MNARLVNIFRERAVASALLTIGVLTLLAVACSRQSHSRSQASRNVPASADPAIEVSPADDASSSDDPCSLMFSNLYVSADSISYNGYEIVRLHKTVYDKASRMDVPVSYAVLRSGGKTIATFEGVYFPAGNGTDFGFASLLGGESKQLIISEWVPRNGRHWVVDFSSNAPTIFDSQEWNLGQEDVCVHDFDGDGVAELSLAIGAFCGIGSMANVECPMIGVVFKYDPQAGKYLPDRSGFAHILDGIEEDVKKIDPNEQSPGGPTGPYLAPRLDIFLRYAYGGRENDGWLFFDRSYNLPDKQDIEHKISAALQQEPAYKFLYGRKPRVRS
jgi:hypothetical protein